MASIGARRLSILTAVVATLPSLAAVDAQATVYGGGALPPIDGAVARPPAGVTLETRPGGRIAMRFDTVIRCGRRAFLPVAGARVVRWNGGFAHARDRGVAHGGLPSEVRVSWSMAAEVEGGTAKGNLRIYARRTRGRRQRCRWRPKRPFIARVATPPTGPPAAPRAGAAYFGLARSTVFRRYRAPVVLRVARGGRRVYARWEAGARCARGPRLTFANLTPPTRVGPAHRFRRSERFTIRWEDSVIRYRVSFGGQFLSDGARGTLRLRARIRYRGHSRRRYTTRCDSGVRRWTALLP